MDSVNGRRSSVNANGQKDSPISPAGKIAEIIDHSGSDQYHFAKRVGISPGYLSMLLQEKRRLTDAVITSLGRTTELPEPQWRNLRDEYEKWKSLHVVQTRTFHTGAATLSGGVLSNQDILRALSEDALKIDPFSEENLSLASLDLTLGMSQLLKPGGMDNAPLEAASAVEREHIIIQPGDTWKLWTRELITMPDNLCGHIAACGDLTTHGILVGFGVQIDPLWSGNPFMILAHMGSEEYELSLEQPFVSLEFRMLTSPCRSNGRTSPKPP